MCPRAAHKALADTLALAARGVIADPGPERLEDPTVPWLAEARIRILVHDAGARGLDRIEDAGDALGQGQLVEAEHGLADGVHRDGDGAGPLAQVRRQPVARELARDGQRREDGGQYRRVADSAVEAESDDRLELLDPPLGALRIERANALPVVATLHRAGGARAITGRQHLLGFNAAPGLDAVAAARRDLEEVRAVVIVEA